MDPRSVLFHRQDGSWDCGEACARSALAWYRAAAPLELDSGILDASATTTVQIIRSIFRSLFSFVANISSLHLPNGTEGPISDGPWWSIDIVAWLRNRGVPCILSTAFAGIHSVHWEDSWYLETLASDKVRVEMLFDRARKEAWPIIAAPVARCETIHEEADDSNPLLKLEDLLSLVESDCLAIVLVDSILLNGTSTGAIAARFSNQCTETSPPEDHRRFIGHFVLLLGRAPNASSSANHVLLFDPSSGPEGGLRCVDAAVFDAARRHPQTDQDVILCLRGKGSEALLARLAAMQSRK